MLALNYVVQVNMSQKNIRDVKDIIWKHMVRKCSDVRLRSKGKKKTAKRRKNREKILGLRDIKKQQQRMPHYSCHVTI